MVDILLGSEIAGILGFESEKQPLLNVLPRLIKPLKDALRPVLLKTFLTAFKGANRGLKHPKTAPISAKSKWALAWTIFAGILYALCDGFSGMSTIMQAILGTGALAFGISTGFAVLSIVLFFMLQISFIADYFGFSWFSPSKALGDALTERELIIQLCEEPRLGSCTPEEHKALRAYLCERIKALQQMAHQLQVKQDSKRMTILFALAVFLVGILVCSSGLFLGYSVVTTVVAFFELTVPFWLPFAIAPVVSLASLGLFYVTQQQDLRRTVNRLAGVDQEWIEILKEDLPPDERAIFSPVVSMNAADAPEVGRSIWQKSSPSQEIDQDIFGVGCGI